MVSQKNDSQCFYCELRIHAKKFICQQMQQKIALPNSAIYNVDMIDYNDLTVTREPQLGIARLRFPNYNKKFHTLSSYGLLPRLRATGFILKSTLRNSKGTVDNLTVNHQQITEKASFAKKLIFNR